MLRFCSGNEETSLKREFPGKGKPDNVIDREKPFTDTYNSGNEVVKVYCHYGAWNNDNVTQFIWYYYWIRNCLTWWVYMCWGGGGYLTNASSTSPYRPHKLIDCLHLYPLKDQHAAEKDLQLISIFLTGLICMLAIHNVKNNLIIFKLYCLHFVIIQRPTCYRKRSPTQFS